MDTNKHELSKDDSLPFDFGLLEVYEKGEPKIRSLQVVDALGHVLARETVRTFQFDEELFFNKQIGKIFPNPLLLVRDEIGNL